MRKIVEANGYLYFQTMLEGLSQKTALKAETALYYVAGSFIMNYIKTVLDPKKRLNREPPSKTALAGWSEEKILNFGHYIVHQANDQSKEIKYRKVTMESMIGMF